MATTLADGARASAHHLANWWFSSPESIGAAQLIAEVADTIAELNGSTTSSEAFGAALTAFLTDPSDANRPDLRSAYEAVPEHLRRYLLGDQDMADWPVRVLVGELGDPVMPRIPPFDVRPVTEEDRRRALDYFSARAARLAEWRQSTNDNDPDGPRAGSVSTSVGEGGTRFMKGGGWVDPSGDGYLSDDVPTPIVVHRQEYPSVTHAYWSLSTDDVQAAEAIRLAPRATEASTLGKAASRKPNWPDLRLAVMAELLRAKFRQHPQLAERLIATGDARIRAAFSLSGSYWQGGAHGRNWLGRLLELVRSELRLERTPTGPEEGPPC
ncbi:MAG: NADAR family protein [Candidatus Dormibacteria bacterium]